MAQHSETCGSVLHSDLCKGLNLFDIMFSFLQIKVHDFNMITLNTVFCITVPVQTNKKLLPQYKHFFCDLMSAVYGGGFSFALNK